MPFRRTGAALRNRGIFLASHEEKTHQEQTKRNCMSVSVIGLLKAVRIALEEVLDKIEVAYQTPQRILIICELRCHHRVTLDLYVRQVWRTQAPSELPQSPVHSD